MTKQNQMFKLIYRSLLLALPVLAFAVPLGWVATPYFEFFNGMAVQPKAKAQGTFGWGLADPHDLPSLNTAEWEPVPGTLPRDYKPYRFAGADPKAEDYQKVIDQAGRELTNPVPRNMENLKRGQELFNTFCYVCHGPLGIGDGPVVGAGRFPAPTSLQDDLIRNYPDGSIYQVITAGKGKMPSYADKLKPEDRWRVIHYVRALQLAQNPEGLGKAEP